MVPNSNICRKECETGYYRDGSGNCLSCTEESASGVTTSQENCAKCAADGDQYARSFVNGKCYRCPSNKPLLAVRHPQQMQLLAPDVAAVNIIMENVYHVQAIVCLT
jgi:hypothetical protein